LELLRVSVVNYLAKYRDDYLRFHDNPTDESYRPGKDWDWPLLGDAAHDLFILRTTVFEIGETLERHVLGANLGGWQPPQIDEVYPFIKSVKLKRFVSECNVEIIYECPGGQSNPDLAIAGDWNEWRPETDVWTPGGTYFSPEYIFRGKFPPGKHRYKFIVDGSWITDPRNPNEEIDEKGNTNSVCVVKKGGEAVSVVKSYMDYSRELDGYLEEIKRRKCEKNG
jgi:hypothetical protein